MPSATESATALAQASELDLRRRPILLSGRLLSTLPRSKSLRHAFEFRDESWFCNEAFRILEEFRFSFCIAHGSGLPFFEAVTGDFVYLRLHGGQVLYGSNYSDQELREWAERKSRNR
jgi:uncharacterized protein YecE (DUF72 family)